MNFLVKILAKSCSLTGDLDYRLVLASMALIFVLFGYQKWFEYEAETLIPFISNGPMTMWMYPRLRNSGSGVESKNAVKYHVKPTCAQALQN